MSAKVQRVVTVPGIGATVLDGTVAVSGSGSGENPVGFLTRMTLDSGRVGQHLRLEFTQRVTNEVSSVKGVEVVGDELGSVVEERAAERSERGIAEDWLFQGRIESGMTVQNAAVLHRRFGLLKALCACTDNTQRQQVLHKAMSNLDRNAEYASVYIQRTDVQKTFDKHKEFLLQCSDRVIGVKKALLEQWYTELSVSASKAVSNTASKRAAAAEAEEEETERTSNESISRRVELNDVFGVVLTNLLWTTENHAQSVREVHAKDVPSRGNWPVRALDESGTKSEQRDDSQEDDVDAGAFASAGTGSNVGERRKARRGKRVNKDEDDDDEDDDDKEAGVHGDEGDKDSDINYVETDDEKDEEDEEAETQEEGSHSDAGSSDSDGSSYADDVEADSDDDSVVDHGDGQGEPTATHDSAAIESGVALTLYYVAKPSATTTHGPVLPGFAIDESTAVKHEYSPDLCDGSATVCCITIALTPDVVDMNKTLKSDERAGAGAGTSERNDETWETRLHAFKQKVFMVVSALASRADVTINCVSTTNGTALIHPLDQYPRVPTCPYLISRDFLTPMLPQLERIRPDHASAAGDDWSYRGTVGVAWKDVSNVIIMRREDAEADAAMHVMLTLRRSYAHSKVLLLQLITAGDAARIAFFAEKIHTARLLKEPWGSQLALFISIAMETDGSEDAVDSAIDASKLLEESSVTADNQVLAAAMDLLSVSKDAAKAVALCAAYVYSSFNRLHSLSATFSETSTHTIQDLTSVRQTYACYLRIGSAQLACIEIAPHEVDETNRDTSASFMERQKLRRHNTSFHAFSEWFRKSMEHCIHQVSLCEESVFNRLSDTTKAQLVDDFRRVKTESDVALLLGKAVSVQDDDGEEEYDYEDEGENNAGLQVTRNNRTQRTARVEQDESKDEVVVERESKSDGDSSDEDDMPLRGKRPVKRVVAKVDTTDRTSRSGDQTFNSAISRIKLDLVKLNVADATKAVKRHVTEIRDSFKREAALTGQVMQHTEKEALQSEMASLVRGYMSVAANVITRQELRSAVDSAIESVIKARSGEITKRVRELEANGTLLSVLRSDYVRKQLPGHSMAQIEDVCEDIEKDIKRMCVTFRRIRTDGMVFPPRTNGVHIYQVNQFHRLDVLKKMRGSGKYADLHTLLGTMITKESKDAEKQRRELKVKEAHALSGFIQNTQREYLYQYLELSSSPAALKRHERALPKVGAELWTKAHGREDTGMAIATIAVIAQLSHFCKLTGAYAPRRTPIPGRLDLHGTCIPCLSRVLNGYSADARPYGDGGQLQLLGTAHPIVMTAQPLEIHKPIKLVDDAIRASDILKIADLPKVRVPKSKDGSVKVWMRLQKVLSALKLSECISRYCGIVASKRSSGASSGSTASEPETGDSSECTDEEKQMRAIYMYLDRVGGKVVVTETRDLITTHVREYLDGLKSGEDAGLGDILVPCADLLRSVRKGMKGLCSIQGNEPLSAARREMKGLVKCLTVRGEERVPTLAGLCRYVEADHEVRLNHLNDELADRWYPADTPGDTFLKCASSMLQLRDIASVRSDVVRAMLTEVKHLVLEDDKSDDMAESVCEYSIRSICRILSDVVSTGKNRLCLAKGVKAFANPMIRKLHSLSTSHMKVAEREREFELQLKTRAARNGFSPAVSVEQLDVELAKTENVMSSRFNHILGEPGNDIRSSELQHWFSSLLRAVVKSVDVAPVIGHAISGLSLYALLCL